jgi:autotransporter-associated beta strand protein
MTNRGISRRFSGNTTRLILLAASTALLASAASSQSLTWDGAGVGNPNGGSGIWDLTGARWYNGSSYVAWPNAGTETSVFGGSAGYVQLGTATSTGSLNFGANYTIYNPGTAISTLTLNNGVLDTGSNRVEIYGPLAGSSGLIKNGSGLFIFHGSNSSLTGDWTINDGTAALGNTAVANIPTVKVTLGATGALDFGVFGGAFNDAWGSLEGAGTVNLGVTPNIGTSFGSRMTVGSTNTNFTYSGRIQGAGRVDKVGSGIMTLGGVNTFRQLDVAGGTVELTGGNAMADDGVVFLANAAGAGNGILSVFGNETLGSIGGGGTTAGTVIVNGGTLTINTPASAINNNAFAGVIAGSGTIHKKGGGWQAITGTTPFSTYTGKYVVEAGTLTFANDNTASGFLDNRMGTAPGSFDATNITLAGGVFTNSGSGFTLNANRGIAVTADSGIAVFGSTASNLTALGSFSGSASITKTGIGVFRMDADNAGYSGDIKIREGALGTARGLFASPLGTGNIDVQGGTLSIAPGASGGVAADIKLASGTGKTVTYGPGAVLLANRNSGNTDLKITIGDAAATSNSLVRGTRGTLVVQASSGLGVAGNERVFINGFNTGTDLKNGIVPAVIGTGAANSATLSTSIGDLVSYNTTDGLVNATYTSTDLNSSAATDIVNQTAGITLGGNRTAYALRLGDGTTGATLDLGGASLSIGGGSDPGMLIMNTSSAVTNGTVHFGAREAIIYTQTSAGNFDGSIVAGSLSKVGIGSLNLGASTVLTYSGDTNINQGAVVLGANNQLSTTSDLNLNGSASLNLNGKSQEVKLLRGTITSNISFGIDGVLKMTGSGDSVYLGTASVTTGSASATLWKAGSGLLRLGQEQGASGAVASSVLGYNKLWVTDGGIVQVSSTNSIPNNPTAVVADTYKLDGGTFRINTMAGSSINAAGATNAGTTTVFTSNTTYGGFRGITIGAGGGTLEVANPLEVVLYQRANGETNGTDDRSLIYGSGTLTKAGPGFFRVGIGNIDFTGKWDLRGGVLQFQTDDPGTLGGSLSLGASLGSVVTDAINFNGGAIQSNGSGILNQNRGFYIGAAGGSFNSGLILNNPISGPGKITKITTGNVYLKNTGNSWSGGIEVKNGGLFVQDSGVAGAGLITLNPEFPLTFGKLFSTTTAAVNGTANALISNAIELKAGSSIDFRVDAPATGNDTLELSGPISGANGFYRNGSATVATLNAGTLVLSSSASTFAGAAVLQSGYTVVKANNALGSVAGPTAVNTGGALVIDGGINYSAAEPLALSGTGISSGGALISSGGNNTFAGPVTIAASASITANSDLTLSAGIRGASDLTIGGTNTLASGGIRVTTLNVNNPRVETTAGRSSSKTSQISTLNLGSGTLDLNDNDLVVGNTTAAAVRAQLISGQITSTVAASQANRALGSAQASEVLGAVYPVPFSGVQVQSGSDVVVRYTYRGDANLNGQVDSVDFNALAAAYGATSGGVWKDGDFNYDDKINTLDFNYLAGNFNATPIPSALPGATLGSVVPEPGSLSLIALGIAGLVARRRR